MSSHLFTSSIFPDKFLSNYSTVLVAFCKAAIIYKPRWSSKHWWEKWHCIPSATSQQPQKNVIHFWKPISATAQKPNSHTPEKKRMSRTLLCTKLMGELQELGMETHLSIPNKQVHDWCCCWQQFEAGQRRTERAEQCFALRAVFEILKILKWRQVSLPEEFHNGSDTKCRVIVPDFLYLSPFCRKQNTLTQKGRTCICECWTAVCSHKIMANSF